MSRRRLSRRSFLVATGTLAAAGFGRSAAADRPRVSNPRATDGDEAFEPNWDERFTLTVGQKKGDMTGKDDRVLQAAVDYVARLGGGTVKLLPGKWTLRNSVFLPSRVRLIGSGADTIITKIASTSVAISEDSDWYDQEISLSDPKSFQVGDGITITVGSDVIKRTLVARSGNRFKLSKGLRKNVWLSGKPQCTSVFPLLTSEYTADVLIENLVLDGNRKNNVNLNGNYGGGIFLQDCNRYTFRKVESRNYNGDGFSFQICHDVLVDQCHSHDNANLGVHPGSGSQRPLIKSCRLERNNIGIFWCWGVKYGLAENNHIEGNRDYGISIGHNDTDNVMKNNTVIDSGKIGVLFRNDARGKDFWANRNTLIGNSISNSGGETGVAIDIQGKTKDLKISGNTLKENRAPMKRIGIRIGEAATRIELAKNAIDGFSSSIVDMRPTA
ncbi:MAG: right-handed parallel beta-helix repeat-containing protein [Planctomycetes bacterium]|nr:right-handed parallel beta-helix repeat-containing protein [Planctomycetota bacterium]